MSIELTNLWEEGFIPHHSWTPTNTKLQWWSSDSLENFETTSNNRYNKNSIIYNFNNYGYRSIDIDLTDQTSKILCVGCSITFGVGLPEDEIWPTHIQSSFSKYKVYNLGVAGASPDTVARILTNSCLALTPDIVLILWPSKSRYETYQDRSKGFISPHGPWNLSKHNIEMFDEMQLYNQFEKNKLIVRLLKDKYKFNLIEFEADKITTKTKNSILARDMQHPGAETHQLISKMFTDSINANTTL